MSYVQGTMIRLLADFSDETGRPAAPGEVICTVEDPTGEVEAYALSKQEVQPDDEVEGRFYRILDTSPAAGTWRYQFESVGNEAVVGRKALTVHAKLQ